MKLTIKIGNFNLKQFYYYFICILNLVIVKKLIVKNKTFTVIIKLKYYFILFLL